MLGTYLRKFCLNRFYLFLHGLKMLFAGFDLWTKNLNVNLEQNFTWKKQKRDLIIEY